ncbi:hypothetical protein [uncultured Desulfosarcina sp.]|uniref:hypothetical protein n=1 Tax=uncultured Desulfosarcina sp. TaxID=218289 RepID=UPI0029C6241F|nr:hypothetical protein [uncultured Desulfosarcina sp.]
MILLESTSRRRRLSPVCLTHEFMLQKMPLQTTPMNGSVKDLMFSGIQEILLIVLIISGIFLVPRMMNPRPSPPKVVLRRPALTFSWTLRLALIVSILWPVACALFFKPWQHDVIPFATVGLGPVVIGWSIKWVLAGIKNKR